MTVKLELTSGNQNVGFLSLNTGNPYSRGRGSNDQLWDYIFRVYTVPGSQSNTTTPSVYFENGTCKCPNASVGDTARRAAAPCRRTCPSASSWSTQAIK